MECTFCIRGSRTALVHVAYWGVESAYPLTKLIILFYYCLVGTGGRFRLFPAAYSQCAVPIVPRCSSRRAILIPELTTLSYTVVPYYGEGGHGFMVEQRTWLHEEIFELEYRSHKKRHGGQFLRSPMVITSSSGAALRANWAGTIIKNLSSRTWDGTTVASAKSFLLETTLFPAFSLVISLRKMKANGLSDEEENPVFASRNQGFAISRACWIPLRIDWIRAVLIHRKSCVINTSSRGKREFSFPIKIFTKEIPLL